MCKPLASCPGGSGACPGDAPTLTLELGFPASDVSLQKGRGRGKGARVGKYRKDGKEKGERGRRKVKEKGERKKGKGEGVNREG